MRDHPDAQAIDRATTVNEVIRVYPDSLSVFIEFGVDTCCGGDVSLAEAALRDGFDLETLMAQLDPVVRSGERTS